MVIAIVAALAIFVDGAGVRGELAQRPRRRELRSPSSSSTGRFASSSWSPTSGSSVATRTSNACSQYHGAEHKTIHAYEGGDPLDVATIQRYSPRHPRCGTSFIIIVAMVAFVVFLTLAPLPFAWQVIARVALIPVIAGLSYEVLRAAAGHTVARVGLEAGHVDPGDHDQGTRRRHRSPSPWHRSSRHSTPSRGGRGAVPGGDRMQPRSPPSSTSVTTMDERLSRAPPPQPRSCLRRNPVASSPIPVRTVRSVPLRRGHDPSTPS